MNELIQTLDDEYQIKLPHSECYSPAKRPRTSKHVLLSRISYVFFQDHARLQNALEELRHCLQTLPTEQERVDWLLARLSVRVLSRINSNISLETPPGSPAKEAQRKLLVMPQETLQNPPQGTARDARQGTPQKLAQELPYETSFAAPQPLSGEDRIKAIQADGLTLKELPGSMKKLSLAIRWEVHRVLQTKEVSSEKLERRWPIPRTLASLHAVASELLPNFVPSPEIDPLDASLCARLRWAKKSTGPVFELDLAPPRKELSNSLQRRFGRDRFLFVDVPALTQPHEASGLAPYARLIPDAVMAMLAQSHHFLLREWRHFHTQKKEGRRKDADFAAPGATQLTFFAVRSHNIFDLILPTTVREVVDWAVPLQENGDSPECKAYARLDLAASKTTPTLEFLPSQVRWIEDRHPTPEPDDSSFNDPNLDFGQEGVSREVMTDGCARMSDAAMRQIQAHLGLPFLPSAVQGRFCGAKGLWIRDDDEGDEVDLQDSGLGLSLARTWIEVAPSQLKVSTRRELCVFNMSRVDPVMIGADGIVNRSDPSRRIARTTRMIHRSSRSPWSAIASMPLRRRCIRPSSPSSSTEVFPGRPSRWWSRQQRRRRRRNCFRLSVTRKHCGDGWAVPTSWREIYVTVTTPSRLLQDTPF